MDEPIDSERRALLKCAALTGAAAVMAGVPAAVYVAAPALGKVAPIWVNIGRRDDIPAGVVKMLPYKVVRKDGWLVLPQQGVVWAKTEGDGRLTVFSSVCPHLGCVVSWREQTQAFHCPCHSAWFDPSGRPVKGPPTRSLDVLEHKVENGNLLVLLTA
jgi:Rieske Fe-S protein